MAAFPSTKVRVVCADWVSHPMDAARAAAWVERLECSNEHQVVPAEAFTETGSRHTAWADYDDEEVVM